MSFREYENEAYLATPQVELKIYRMIRDEHAMDEYLKCVWQELGGKEVMTFAKEELRRRSLDGPIGVHVVCIWEIRCTLIFGCDFGVTI